MRDREKIIEALATMDDEAFSWFVLAIPPSAMLHGGTCQIWPDGLGGFQDRETIEALRTAAQAWLRRVPAQLERGESDIERAEDGTPLVPKESS